MNWDRAAVSVAFLLLLTVAFHTISHGENIPIRRTLESFPRQIGARQGRDVELDARLLEGLKADDVLTRLYDAPNQPPIGLYIAYFQSQRQGQTIHSPKNCLPGSGWSAVEARRETVDLAPGDRVNLNRYVVQDGLERQLVLYWYQSHGRVIASEYVAKVDLAIDAIRLNRTDGALVRISLPIENDPDSSERVAREFLGQIHPLLTEYIPQ